MKKEPLISLLAKPYQFEDFVNEGDQNEIIEMEFQNSEEREASAHYDISIGLKGEIRAYVDKKNGLGMQATRTRIQLELRTVTSL